MEGLNPAQCRDEQVVLCFKAVVLQTLLRVTSAGGWRGSHAAVHRRTDGSREGSSAPRTSSGESQPGALPGQRNPILGE